MKTIQLNDDIQLRRLKLDDIPAVRTVVAGAFNSADLGAEVARRFFLYCRSGQSGSDLTDQLDQQIPCEYWLLEDTCEHACIGICGLYRAYWWWEGCLWLGWLAVDPSKQGHGYGTSMLNALITIARSRGASVLKVETSADGPATRFYLRMGFTVEGRLTQLYSANTDGVVMSRKI